MKSLKEHKGMPIYEFRCQACSEIFEHLAMSSSDEFEAKCPHCGGVELNRVMSASNSVVNGSDGGPSGCAGGVQNRTCGSNNCSTITLPGHTR
jgi:putative FmdB family regulatory protein